LAAEPVAPAGHIQRWRVAICGSGTTDCRNVDRQFHGSQAGLIGLRGALPTPQISLLLSLQVTKIVHALDEDFFQTALEGRLMTTMFHPSAA
jgi:hypothetical protein